MVRNNTHNTFFFAHLGDQAAGELLGLVGDQAAGELLGPVGDQAAGELLGRVPK